MAREQTPAQVADKWKRRTQAATQDMVAGVNAVTVAPGQQAAAKSDKMLQKVTESVTSGRWARRVGSVSLEEWKKQMIDKGAARVSSGVAAAEAKSTAFYAEFLPHVASVQAEVKRMPDLTLEDSIQRMVANARGLSKFKRGGGRG